MKRNILTIAALLAGVLLLGADQAAWAQRGGPPGGFGGPGGGGGDPRNQGGGEPQSPTLTAAVVAVADTRSNSLVISAPEELLPMIEKLIDEMDSIIENKEELKVFPLRYADAEEMAGLVEEMFQDNNNRGGRFFGGGRSSSTQTQVTAKEDPRTNSVIVSADSDKMPRIELMIQMLDQDPSRDKKVFIHKLENADPETVAAMIEEMLGGSGGGGGNSNRRTTNTSNRTTGTNNAQRSNFGGGGGNTGGGGR